MLVFSRKVGERIQIGDGIEITVVRISPNSVRIGIDAPPDSLIARQELADQFKRQASESARDERPK